MNDYMETEDKSDDYKTPELLKYWYLTFNNINS